MNKLVYVFVGIILIIIICFVVFNDNDISIYGKYNCTNNDENIVLILNKDKTFEYNNLKGFYSYVKITENKYALDFDSDNYKSQMELSIKLVNNKKQGKLMMLSNNNIYECTEK